MLAVDQVFALARSIQPPRHLDVAAAWQNSSTHRRSGRRRHGRAVAVPVAVAIAAIAVGRSRRCRPLGSCALGTASAHAAEAQPHFGGAGRLARVAAAEDDVFHLLAAEALGALLAEHPRDGVGDVALAAAVGSDDGGDASVEGELRAIGKGFEAGDLKAFEPHGMPRHRSMSAARTEVLDRPMRCTGSRQRDGSRRGCGTEWQGRCRRENTAT